MVQCWSEKIREIADSAAARWRLPWFTRSVCCCAAGGTWMKRWVELRLNRDWRSVCHSLVSTMLPGWPFSVYQPKCTELLCLIKVDSHIRRSARSTTKSRAWGYLDWQNSFLTRYNYALLGVYGTMRRLFVCRLSLVVFNGRIVAKR